MFQPARPSLTWSIVANCLATVNGSLYVVESVAASPIWDVCAARYASSVNGSNRFRKFGCDFSLMYNPSPKNTKSSFEASALRVRSR